MGSYMNSLKGRTRPLLIIAFQLSEINKHTATKLDEHETDALPVSSVQGNVYHDPTGFLFIHSFEDFCCPTLKKNGSIRLQYHGCVNRMASRKIWVIFTLFQKEHA
jgi:hypothetical protein